jgi:hypothetical protein
MDVLAALSTNTCPLAPEPLAPAVREIVPAGPRFALPVEMEIEPVRFTDVPVIT